LKSGTVYAISEELKGGFMSRDHKKRLKRKRLKARLKRRKKKVARKA